MKAQFQLQTGGAADAPALEKNLHAIEELAAKRGDKAIRAMTWLLEGLAHLKSMKGEDSIVRVQTCIAQASSYQLDPSVHIPQLDALMLMLDLACSLLQRAPDITMRKQDILQERLDALKNSPAWQDGSSEMLLPLCRQSTSSPTISHDTAAVLRPGNGDHDFLVMKSLSIRDAFALA